MPGKCVRKTILDIVLDPTVGHEAKKPRPCLVIQNDIGNRYSPLTIVAVLIGGEHVTKDLPINIRIPKGEGGLVKVSVVMCNQLRTVDEQRFGKTYGQALPDTMKRVDAALRISLGLNSTPSRWSRPSLVRRIPAFLASNRAA
jgi:mRNA interferase MazF